MTLAQLSELIDLAEKHVGRNGVHYLLGAMSMYVTDEQAESIREGLITRIEKEETK